MAFFVPVFKSIAGLVALINLGIVASRGMYIKKADLIAGKIGDTLESYSLVFEKIQAETWQSDLNKELAQTLVKNSTR